MLGTTGAIFAWVQPLQRNSIVHTPGKDVSLLGIVLSVNIGIKTSINRAYHTYEVRRHAKIGIKDNVYTVGTFCWGDMQNSKNNASRRPLERYDLANVDDVPGRLLCGREV